jgi:hypothetical protein
MPRRSAASSEIAPYTQPSPIQRLKPPATMSEPARRIFVDAVLGSRADHFQATDLPLLVRFCEANATAERAEAEMAREPVIDGKASPWISIWGQATKAATALAMRLRLSPQARAPNNASRPVRQLSFYERQDLVERQLQDEDTAQ